MVRVEIPRYIDISNSDIQSVLRRLNINDDYTVDTVVRYGRNLIIHYQNSKTYVLLSGNEASGRNSFLNQYTATVLYKFVKDDSEEKKLHAFLLDTSSKAKTAYMIDTYRMLKTIGIDILNEDELNLPEHISPYRTIDEWKNARDERKKYNPANKSTYILVNADSVNIYGKAFGANGKESTFICCVIAKLAQEEGKDVHLFQVEDNNVSQLSINDHELLVYYGVKVQPSIISKFVPSQYTVLEEIGSIRDQATFQYNLLNKYGDKKCLICGNNIEELIIASHIHRIADIKNSNISFEEKCKLAVDPDNGFWLCANHDKMFENGLIHFDKQALRIANEIKPLVTYLKNSVERITSNISNDILRNQISDLIYRNSDFLVLEGFKIPNMFYSQSMELYLENHKKRVKGF